MNLIKKIRNGNTDIEIYSSDISEEEQKNNLSNLYNVINKIADNQRNTGNNVDNWFYKEKEINNMKKSNTYKFI